MAEMESDQEVNKLAAIKAATLDLAKVLGLRLESGHRLRISAQPPIRSAEPEDKRLLRITMARAWATAMLATDREFGSGLTGAPAWAMLIDLYISQVDGRPVTISDAGHAARVPSTTGLRWVRVLEDRGYIYRQDDRKDGRRVFLRLTALGLERLELVLDRVAESDTKIGLGRMSLIE